MKIQFRYPAVLRYQDVPRQLPRHHVWTRKVVAEVTELGSSDAPEVLRWTPDDASKGVSYRLVDGKLYGLMNTNLASATCRTSVDYPTLPLVEKALERLRAVVAEKGPSFVRGEFHEPTRWPHERGDNWHPQAALEDVVEWDGLFTACVADMAVVDGQLWRVCREPLVVVYRNTAGWQTALTQDVSFTQDLQRFHFPADRWAEAQDFCRAMVEASGRPFFAGHFVSDPVWSSERDTRICDLVAIASRFARHISRAVADKATKRTEYGALKPRLSWHDLPTWLFSSYGEMRRILDMNEECIGEEEATVLVECFETILMNSNRPGLSWIALQPEAVRAHIEKWNSRPIELNLGKTRDLHVRHNGR